MAKIKPKQAKTIRLHGAAKHKRKIDELKKQFDKQLMILNKVITVVPGHLYWLDKNGVILGCNEQQAKDLNLPSRESIVGKTLFDLQPHELALPLHENNMRILSTGKDEVFEEQATFSEKMVTCLSHKMPMCDDEGKVIGLIGTSIDITDRKKAEEYRQKHEAAGKVIKFSNLVAGSIAHELKNPLSGIRIQMEVLRNIDFKKPLSPASMEILHDMANTIIKTIDSTIYVISDMLVKLRAFATGEVQQQNCKKTSIVTDVENILKSYPFKNGERNLIKTSYESKFEYLGDSIITSHVLSNLIKNSLHAIDNAGKGEITITTKTQDNCNVLIFKDTASGIPKNFVGKIFDQFETKKAIHSGAGLGLAFCKMVMEDYYGGHISCSSKEGKYTEFELKFPLLK